jgi:hypothetical protein
MMEIMRLRLCILALCGITTACGLADIFKSAEISGVAMTYTGPTTVSVADTFPLSVTVTIAGRSVPAPRLWVTTADTTILAVTASGDTVIARSRGFDTLTIRLVGSIYTDSFPTIRQAIKVNP